LDVNAVAELFQDFYVQVESHIAAHIAASLVGLSNDSSPITPKSASLAKNEPNDLQQLLTPTELLDKRRSRKQLEMQRLDLEEAVERIVCEKMYDKIYRHKSTHDQDKDAKLRSKTASLALVGVSLKDLNVNIPADDSETLRKLHEEIHQGLEPARKSLQRMDEPKEHYPLGKLKHLMEAHRKIVETLAQVFPTSSSADEVLPTLIYTLITSPPELLNVASNLHFIQLFRNAVKVDGETAYCLVNLEAAMTFLETVDLATLQVDPPQVPPKHLDESSGTHTRQSPNLTQTQNESRPSSMHGRSRSAINVSLPFSPESPSKVARSLANHQRRLSVLIHSQADVGKAQFMDQAIGSINTTLESSFKYLFGRLRESDVEKPKTLDDAMRIVHSPTHEVKQDRDRAPSPRSPLKSQMTLSIIDPLARNDSDRDFDEERLQDAIVSNEAVGKLNETPSQHEGASTSAGATTAEAVGNFVNSLNPLTRFGVPSLAMFGRTASGSQTVTESSHKRTLSDFKPFTSSERDMSQNKIEPAIAKFVAMSSAQDLRISEVEELLKDYHRLARLVEETNSRHNW